MVSSKIVCPSSSTGTSSRTKEVTKHRLMFGLRLVDDTAAVDVIVCDSEAEHFLGVTAREFQRDAEGVQAAVEARLARHRDEEIVSDFYIKSYSTLAAVPAPAEETGAGASSRRGPAGTKESTERLE